MSETAIPPTCDRCNLPIIDQVYYFDLNGNGNTKVLHKPCLDQCIDDYEGVHDTALWRLTTTRRLKRIEEKLDRLSRTEITGVR